MMSGRNLTEVSTEAMQVTSSRKGISVPSITCYTFSPTCSPLRRAFRSEGELKPPLVLQGFSHQTVVVNKS